MSPATLEAEKGDFESEVTLRTSGVGGCEQSPLASARRHPSESSFPKAHGELVKNEVP